MFGGKAIPKQYKMALYASIFNIVTCYINTYAFWSNATVYNLGSALFSLVVGAGIYMWITKQVRDMLWNTLKS